MTDLAITYKFINNTTENESNEVAVIRNKNPCARCKYMKKKVYAVLVIPAIMILSNPLFTTLTKLSSSVIYEYPTVLISAVCALRLIIPTLEFWRSVRQRKNI